MDEEVLNSKLPGDLVDLILDFKPRDREMKSAAWEIAREQIEIWKEYVEYFSDPNIPDAVLMYHGPYLYEYRRDDDFVTWFFRSQRRLEEDEDDGGDTSDFSDSYSAFCDCCAKEWEECQCWCSGCGAEYSVRRLQCFG